MLLFKGTLTKHLSSKKEDVKVKLKWNGTLIDFRDFVSLILKFKVPMKRNLVFGFFNN